MSVPATKKLWQGLAIGFAIAFAYATVMAKLFRDWWNDENYSHGLLIPIIIGYILWTQREKLARVPANSSLLWGGAAILFGSSPYIVRHETRRRRRRTVEAGVPGEGAP